MLFGFDQFRGPAPSLRWLLDGLPDNQRRSRPARSSFYAPPPHTANTAVPDASGDPAAMVAAVQFYKRPCTFFGTS